MVRTAQMEECRTWQRGKSTPSKGKRSSQEIAIAPVHQFVALGNEAAGPILEESAGSAPVLGDAPLQIDTGVAIANTSMDPFGTINQTGTVKLWYYGTLTGGTPVVQPPITQAIPAGQELIFTLSAGGNFGATSMPGFEGYIIAVANFQYCHGFAFISDVGAQKLAEGYLAIQLDEPFNLGLVPLTRTKQLGESQAH